MTEDPQPFRSLLTPEAEELLKKISAQLFKSDDVLKATRAMTMPLTESLQLQELTATFKQSLEPVALQLSDYLSTTMPSITIPVGRATVSAEAGQVAPTTAETSPHGLPAPGPIVGWAAAYGAVYALVESLLGDDVRAAAGTHAVSVLAMLTIVLLDMAARG